MLLRNLNHVVETLANAKRDLVVVTEFAIASCIGGLRHRSQVNLANHAMWTPTLATAGLAMPSSDGIRDWRTSRPTPSVMDYPGGGSPYGIRREAGEAVIKRLSSTSSRGGERLDSSHQSHPQASALIRVSHQG